MGKKRILIVDDEIDIRQVISVILKKEDYITEMAADGRAAVEEIQKGKKYDLIIMDIIMPRMDGVTAVKEIRKSLDCPVLFLTAKSTDDDKTQAYSSGGDDYLVKPFSKVELLLRVKALLKRYGGYEIPEEMIFDFSKHGVKKAGREIKLTEKEFELFYFLFQNQGSTFSVQELYEKVWGEKFMKSSSNTVMVHILNLRKKIEDDFANPKYIMTVWGKGYSYGN